jgi:predicted nucleic acid-binding protein
MEKILIDSGPMIALFDQSDRYHGASVEFIRNCNAELVTTLASLTETLHLLDFNRQVQMDFLTWVNAGALTIESVDIHGLSRVQALMQKYLDLPMDFADACLVYLAEKLNIQTIATIDRDFDVYRIKGKHPFTTLIKG